MSDDAGRTSDAAAGAPELSFEDAFERLEALVERLEAGELSLEEALAAFEEGVRLERRLEEQLRRAERRIEVLVREGGALVERSLEDLEEPT
jgi:exodeoxyribonuclease VII small subunit